MDEDDTESRHSVCHPALFLPIMSLVCILISSLIIHCNGSDNFCRPNNTRQRTSIYVHSSVAAFFIALYSILSVSTVYDFGTRPAAAHVTRYMYTSIKQIVTRATPRISLKRLLQHFPVNFNKPHLKWRHRYWLIHYLIHCPTYGCPFPTHQ